LKVLIVTNQFPSGTYPYKGSFIYEQVNELKKKIKQVYVLSPNYGNDSKYEIYKEINVHRFKTFTKRVKDPLLRTLFSGVTGFISLLFFVSIQILMIFKLSIKYKVDIIHAHWILPSGFSSFLVSRILRKKFVVTIHGSDLSFCKKKVILNSLLGYILQRADLIICISKKIAQEAMEFNLKKEKIKTIYLGISKNIFDLCDSQNQKRSKNITKIVMVGSLYPIKGIDFLLQIIKKISEIKNNFEFHIVGDGVLMDEVKQFINKNSLESKCKIYGFQPHEKVLRIICDSDICVQTSKTEGLSVVVQESVAMGKAVIATNVGGTAEIVIDGFNGFLVRYNDIESATQLFKKLLSSPELIKKMGKNSRKIAKEKLVLEKNVNDLILEYKNIVKSSYQ